jgi:hypothetical protein
MISQRPELAELEQQTRGALRERYKKSLLDFWDLCQKRSRRAAKQRAFEAMQSAGLDYFNAHDFLIALGTFEQPVDAHHNLSATGAVKARGGCCGIRRRSSAGWRLKDSRSSGWWWCGKGIDLLAGPIVSALRPANNGAIWGDGL